MATLLYKQLARYYDLVYANKDYKEETKRVKEVVDQNNHSGGNKLLEAACGTGGHIQYLKDDYDCTAFDINKEMVEVAKERAPGVRFFQADMTHIDLKETFDVIICLFSSIGYVRTLGNLEKTLKNFAKHLNPGGVVVIQPWLDPEDFISGLPWMDTYEDKDIKIARLGTSTNNRNISILDMHYLIAEKDKGVKYFKEKHELGMFTVERFKEAMEEAGFQKVQYLDSKESKMDRGLYVGNK